MYCDLISLNSKILKNENENKRKIICNNCYERINNIKNNFEEYIYDEISSNILKQIISNYKVCCINNNCKWIGKLSQLKNHIIKDCKYQPVKCPNIGCNLILIKKDLNSHLVQCVFDETIFKIKCNFCEKEIRKNNIENHFEECPEMMIECDKKCGHKTKRKDLENHMIKCPENLIKCKYWKYGCKKFVKRKFLEDHEILEILNHYNFVNNYFNNLEDNSNEKDSINNIINDLNKKIKKKWIKNNQKIQLNKREQSDESLLLKENNKNNEEKKKIEEIINNYDDYIPFTGEFLKFISSIENIQKRIIIFKKEKFLYSGNYYSNNEGNKYCYVIGQKSLDLKTKTNFRFKIQPDPTTNNLPWIAFGLFNVINEEDKYFNNLNNFPKYGLYTIDLESNSCLNGVTSVENNDSKLYIESEITISYLPNKNLFIIKDKNDFTISFPNIPNDKCDLRICFIFKGEDRATIKYNY